MIACRAASNQPFTGAPSAPKLMPARGRPVASSRLLPVAVPLKVAPTCSVTVCTPLCTSPSMLRCRAVIAIRPWAITRETSVLIAVASVMLGSTVWLTLAKL